VVVRNDRALHCTVPGLVAAACQRNKEDCEGGNPDWYSDGADFFDEEEESLYDDEFAAMEPGRGKPPSVGG